MFKKVLILTAIVLVLSPCQIQAAQISVTWDGGGDGLSWADANNWKPNIVPDNNTATTFAVTVDAGQASIGLTQNRTIDQLDCYALVELYNNTPDWIELTLIDSTGLTNYGELEIEGEWRMQINGNVTNTTGKELELWGMIDIDGNLYNSPDATIEAGGTDIGVDGNVHNSGTIIIDPETEFCTGVNFHNAHEIILRGGQCEAGELFHNTGAIQGFGFIRTDDLLQNTGTIFASGGSLAILSDGSITNIGKGVLGNEPLSSLHIKAAVDVNNNSTIEVNTGGGVAFDCNLVNEPNAVINLHGGALAATTITQRAGATFAGFGGIAGNLIIESNGEIKLTGPTNIVGDVEIRENATLEISDGTTLVTGRTTCNGTIHLKGGRIIPQAGLSGDCNIIWEPGLYTNIADFNLDGKVNIKDFALFADTWLWQTSWY